MDIIFHITLFCILAILFFLNRYTGKSNNMMLFAIFFSIVGVLATFTVEPYYTQDEVLKYNNTSIVGHSNATVYEQEIKYNFADFGTFNGGDVFLLGYLFFLFIASLNIYVGKEDFS
jgi:hypothetical protein